MGLPRRLAIGDGRDAMAPSRLLVPLKGIKKHRLYIFIYTLQQSSNTNHHLRRVRLAALFLSFLPSLSLALSRFMGLFRRVLSSSGDCCPSLFRYLGSCHQLGFFIISQVLSSPLPLVMMMNSFYCQRLVPLIIA